MINVTDKLRRIVDKNTIGYKEDLDIDLGILMREAEYCSDPQEFYWLSRRNGTQLVRVDEALDPHCPPPTSFTKWEHCDGIIACLVTVAAITPYGELVGTVEKIDYAATIKRIKEARAWVKLRA